MAKRGWILAVILAGLMVVGVGGGVILAGGGKDDGDYKKVGAESASLTARVAEILGLEEGAVSDAFEEAKDSWDGEGNLIGDAAEILGVEESELEDALAQARRTMADEAVRVRMDAMVEKGVITQAEADEYVSWFESRPAFLDRIGKGWGDGRGKGRHDRGKGRDG